MPGDCKLSLVWYISYNIECIIRNVLFYNLCIFLGLYPRSPDVLPCIICTIMCTDPEYTCTMFTIFYLYSMHFNVLVTLASTLPYIVTTKCAPGIYGCPVSTVQTGFVCIAVSLLLLGIVYVLIITCLGSPIAWDVS